MPGIQNMRLLIARGKSSTGRSVPCLPTSPRSLPPIFFEFLGRGDFAGLFVCLRSQSKPADFADQYGFNTPVREDFQARYGIDIRQEDFDLQAWRDLLGAYLTLFLTELRTELNFWGIRLAVGVPRSDVIGPPMGNTTLDWRRWVTTGTIDELIINQNSSQCPSMWHQLWPMHRGIRLPAELYQWKRFASAAGSSRHNLRSNPR